MATPKKDEKEKVAPIIVKKIIKKGGGHHGGAWKVAYADFVTAMMAFFLLLWLLNVTTKEQKNAISDYFDPSHPKVSDTMSGAGGILGGMTVSQQGAMVTTVQPLIQTQTRVTDTHGELQGVKSPDGKDTSDDKIAKELEAKENKRFEEAAEKLKAEIAKSPELKDLQKNILIDITPEGLRIQIVDDKGRSMFPSGSAVMYDFMRDILLKISAVIVNLPNQASVRGHTDSNKYKDPRNYDNWNLSADRAQASRRVLVTGGLPEARVENVMGRADREPLDKDPAAARNRRISIILLRMQPTKEDIAKQKAEDAKAASEKKALEGQTGAPLTIIDDTTQGPMKPADAKPADTKPDASEQTPAQGTAGTGTPAGDPNATRQENNQPEFLTPLPTTPSPETFKQQPQVMYFGDSANAPKTTAPLYEGPVVAPITRNKPPQIHVKLFDLGDEDTTTDKPEPVRTPAPSAAPVTVAPVVTPSQKSVSFGDAVPAQAAPLSRAPLPVAPALQLDNSKSGPAPAPTPQILQFGELPPANSIVPNIVPPVTPPATTTPTPVPAKPSADLELVNPTPQKAAPTPAITLPSGPSAQTPVKKDKAKQELTF